MTVVTDVTVVTVVTVVSNFFFFLQKQLFDSKNCVTNLCDNKMNEHKLLCDQQKNVMKKMFAKKKYIYIIFC